MCLGASWRTLPPLWRARSPKLLTSLTVKGQSPMALSSNRPTAALVYSVLDSSGSKGRVLVHVPYATLATAALTAAEALGVLITALTGCTILSVSLTYTLFDEAPVAPSANSFVEDKGVFQFRLANGLTTRIDIPGILPVVLRQSGAINTADPAVAAFIAGVIGVDAIFAGVDGSDITSLLAAYKRSTSSTKNQLPSDRNQV